MKYIVAGLRELLFFGKGITWSTPVSILVWIRVVRMCIILATLLKTNSVQGDKSHSNA